MQQQIDLLNDAKSHFDHWRSTRAKRGKIPDYLWSKVKPLIGKYSLTTIIDALNINKNQLREHVYLSDKINFVELKTAATSKFSSAKEDKIFAENKCCIELHRSTGETLKIIHYPIESLHIIITQFLG